MATINNIKKRADEIKNAYEPESVTAEKVGQLFEDIADVTEQVITSSEEVMQESVRASEQAAQAAEEASGYLSDLQEAIADLPDGSAVTAEVADHEVRVADLEANSATKTEVAATNKAVYDTNNKLDGIISTEVVDGYNWYPQETIHQEEGYIAVAAWIDTTDIQEIYAERNNEPQPFYARTYANGSYSYVQVSDGVLDVIDVDKVGIYWRKGETTTGYYITLADAQNTLIKASGNAFDRIDALNKQANADTQKILNLKDYINGKRTEVGDWEYGYWYKTNGEKQTLNERRYSEIIAVNTGDKVYYNCIASSAGFMLAAFNLSMELDISNSVAGTGSVADRIYTVPEGVRYLQFFNYNNETYYGCCAILLTTYEEPCVYVSSSEGSDTNDGFSPEHPKKTFANAYSLCKNIRLKCGDTFYNAIRHNNNSVRLNVGSYGSGAKPVLSGCISTNSASLFTRGKFVASGDEYVWQASVDDGDIYRLDLTASAISGYKSDNPRGHNIGLIIDRTSAKFYGKKCMFATEAWLEAVAAEDSTIKTNVQRDTYLKDNMDFYQTNKSFQGQEESTYYNDYRYLYIKVTDTDILSHKLEFSIGINAVECRNTTIENIQIRQFGAHAIVGYENIIVRNCDILEI